MQDFGSSFTPFKCAFEVNSCTYTVQVLEAQGLQTILDLLPTPYAEPATNAAAPAGTSVAPAWANKPQSSGLQTSLLQLFAAIVQSAHVRSSILASDSSPDSTTCLSILLNMLDPDAPPLPASPPAAGPPAGGKGAAVGKPDGKAKAAGKGKEAAPPVPVAPPPELLPPFPAAVQVSAVQCLQVSITAAQICLDTCMAIQLCVAQILLMYCTH